MASSRDARNRMKSITGEDRIKAWPRDWTGHRVRGWRICCQNEPACSILSIVALIQNVVHIVYAVMNGFICSYLKCEKIVCREYQKCCREDYV